MFGNDTQLYSLHGVKRFYVLVENLQPEAKRIGLTKAELQSDIELKLNSAGITVLTGSEAEHAIGGPYLYANINNTTNFYGIEISFTQPVLLERDQNIQCFASTWNIGGIGGGAKPQLREQIRHKLGDYIDTFIIDYLRSNSWK